VISDEAVEAAVGKVLEAVDANRSAYQIAYTALEAAVPFIAAQAWDEGADFMSAGCWTETGSPGNPYRSGT
jgi:hypothetical protein